MPIALLPYEAVALAAVCKALRGSNLQVRQPSYLRPSFWSRPFYITNYLPVAPNTGWTDLVRVNGLPQYVGVVKQYVATSLGSLVTAGLEFRLFMDGLPMEGVQFSPGMDLNKDGPNTYPVVPRDTFIPVNQTQRLALQVRNPTANQQIAMGTLAGWYFDSVDSTVTSNSNAMVDGVYSSMVGVPHANQ